MNVYILKLVIPLVCMKVLYLCLSRGVLGCRLFLYKPNVD